LFSSAVNVGGNRRKEWLRWLRWTSLWSQPKFESRESPLQELTEWQTEQPPELSRVFPDNFYAKFPNSSTL
jgi:hypothetical protein